VEWLENPGDAGNHPAFPETQCENVVGLKTEKFQVTDFLFLFP